MSEWKRRLRPRNDLQWIALVVVVVLALLAVGHVALDFALTGMQSAVTVVAIVSGAAFALFKLQAFRAFEPHLTISQEVSHRTVGDRYIHIVVTCTLHNSSRVRVHLREGLFRLQQVRPLPDHEIERLYTEVFVDYAARHLQWPTLEDATRVWGKNDASVEPGESHQETFEFIIDSVVRSVLVYTYIYNAKANQDPSAPMGWTTTTVHDIIEA